MIFSDEKNLYIKKVYMIQMLKSIDIEEASLY